MVFFMYREKTVYITTHKSARGPRRRDVTHILSKVSCFLLESFYFRRLQKRQVFFRYRSLYFEDSSNVTQQCRAWATYGHYLHSEWQGSHNVQQQLYKRLNQEYSKGKFPLFILQKKKVTCNDIQRSPNLSILFLIQSLNGRP